MEKPTRTIEAIRREAMVFETFPAAGPVKYRAGFDGTLSDAETDLLLADTMRRCGIPAEAVELGKLRPGAPFAPLSESVRKAEAARDAARRAPLIED